MSILTNSNWYDNNGQYVPLSDRDISDNDVFGRIFKDMDNVADYNQIGSYLHVHTDEKPETIAAQVENRHGNISVTIQDHYEKGYCIADSNHVVKLQFSAK